MIAAIRAFFALKIAPGILLVSAAVLALVLQNSGVAGFYELFKNVPVVVQFGGFVIDKPLLLWINDGLMAIFFLLVGLEIKREFLMGHLAGRQQFSLPAIAAIGGVVVPALIYYFINQGDAVALRGWAIPAATDIAFALGVMLLLGDRVPASLKVLLVAIATIDDLIAIIVIALFYTAEISTLSLTLGLCGLAVAAIMNRCGVTKLGPYMMVGLFIWACVLKSGVHATLAGVALGLIIPLKVKNDEGRAPLKVLEHALHPWVVFLILPVFAFANAGVSLAGVTLQTFLAPITLGIILGLFIGKQVGIFAITWLAVKLKLCKLPDGVTWPQFYGMAIICGIGFTMSLFIGTLSFESLEQAREVRIGVLTGSFLSAIVGVAFLRFVSRPRP
jgi:Na+:H+ antiporter, NhaA family